MVSGKTKNALISVASHNFCPTDLQRIPQISRMLSGISLFLCTLTLAGCQIVQPTRVTTPPIQQAKKPLAEIEPIAAASEEHPEAKTSEVADTETELDRDVATPTSGQSSTGINKFAANHFFTPSDKDQATSILSRVISDHKNFYSAESLTLLGGGLVVGGAIANSSADQSLQHIFQSAVLNANSDDWFESMHASKELGNGVYTLPVFATAWSLGELLPDSQVAQLGGQWGERSIRGFLVGAPPLIALQQLTGGSRPTETAESAEWHPFTDNNGISGHSFMGSLPFITAAKMSDGATLKATFYAASAIAPLSRVNDNAHYPSQVALGWWMAYLAASAVEATERPSSQWKFFPYSTGESTGILAEFKY